MSDCNLTQNEEDYKILQQNFEKLDFICDVAIYTDKTASKRDHINLHKRLTIQNNEIPKDYNDFESWLKIICNKHNISENQLRTFINKILHNVNQRLIEYKGINEYKAVDIEEQFDLELKNLLHWDEELSTYSVYNQVMEMIFSTEANYSLVTKNKTFLIGDPKRRFYHDIKIDQSGLFILQTKSRCYRKKGIVDETTSSILVDFEGNQTDEHSLFHTTTILSNRISSQENKDFYKTNRNFHTNFSELLNELDQYGIEIKWPLKNIKYKSLIKFDIERPDGLVFYLDEREYKDSSSIWIESVKDSKGNNTSLYVLYKHLKMLNNGRIYLMKLAQKYVNKQKHSI